MKKVIGIVLIGFFVVALLSSCGSRRKDGCPNNFSITLSL